MSMTRRAALFGLPLLPGISAQAQPTEVQIYAAMTFRPALDFLHSPVARVIFSRFGYRWPI